MTFFTALTFLWCSYMTSLDCDVDDATVGALLTAAWWDLDKAESAAYMLFFKLSHIEGDIRQSFGLPWYEVFHDWHQINVSVDTMTPQQRALYDAYIECKRGRLCAAKSRQRLMRERGALRDEWARLGYSLRTIKRYCRLKAVRAELRRCATLGLVQFSRID